MEIILKIYNKLIFNKYYSMTIYFVFSYQIGWTPLHAAVVKNNVQMVRLLIQAGAKTNLPNKVMVCFILNKLQMCIIMKYSLCTTNYMNFQVYTVNHIYFIVWFDIYKSLSTLSCSVEQHILCTQTQITATSYTVCS